MPRLRDGEDLGALCGVAAERLGIPAAVVEKDYWVAQALRGLQAAHPDEFIFKGGTSLSKAYALIERFSEDIDILVIERAGESKSARYTRVKRMTAVAGAAVGDPGAQEKLGADRTGRQRTALLHYGRAGGEPQLMLPHIRLDIGIAPGVEPHTRRPIGTLVGDVLKSEQSLDLTAFDDLVPFDVQVLHPGRTLLEKLLLVHTAAVRSGSDTARWVEQRAARHFYDIHCLLDHSETCELLADRDAFDRILRQAVTISDEHFGGVEPRPADGFAASPAFSPHVQLADAIADEYRATMQAFYFGDGAYPALAAIRERVSDRRQLL